MSDFTDFINPSSGQAPKQVQKGTKTSYSQDSGTEQDKGINSLQNATGRNGVFLDTVNGRIIISDGTNNRVVLGNLSATSRGDL